ncbi:MAG: uroporphyrinogen decarboxylase family protein [Bacteroidota bacterium]
MKGKELINQAFRQEKPERIPWVPFVGVHGGYLIDVNAKKYLTSREYLVRGISEAIDRYDPDGIPVMFDLQVEAEVLGCGLQWSDDNPPSVISHPLMEGKTVNDLPEFGPNQGRLPIVLEATRQLRTKYPDVALYGLVTGPFTLALHLMGTEIFTQMMIEPDSIKEVLEYTRQIAQKTASYYIEAGVDVVAIVDPMTSQIDPGSFETFVSPPATQIFDYIRGEKVWSSFFVCGHAQQNIEAMCRCRPDNVSIDENIPLEYVREVALNHNISFGGNLRLTVVLLLGSQEDAQREAMECMDSAGNKGFILAPGCDLPMKTPPENLQAITTLVRDPYQQEVIRTLEQKEDTEKRLNLQDYGNTEKVIVDVITLDSESCTPCRYMVEAVKQVAPHFEGIVEWREHSVKDVQSVSFMSSLYVKNIPTICIDGQITFVSQIPPKNKLIEAIQQRINEKLRLKVSANKGELLVLGASQEECNELLPLMEQAKSELGSDLPVRCITDPNTLASFGVTNTPAVVSAHYRLKSQGNRPSVEVIKEWIKTIAEP